MTSILSEEFGNGSNANLHKNIEMRGTDLDRKGLFAKEFIPKGILTQNDYTMSNLQEKYRGHFVSFIQKKINDMSTSSFNGER